jgi:hypothetical protein
MRLEGIKNAQPIPTSLIEGPHKRSHFENLNRGVRNTEINFTEIV